MAITRSQTKAAYARRSCSPTGDRRKTKGTQDASSDFNCETVTKALNTFFRAAFLPLLIFTICCIARMLYQVDGRVNWHAPHFPAKIPDWLVALVIVTAFSGLIKFTPSDEADSGATRGQGGEANSNDRRIRKRRTSASPPARKAATGRRSNSPAARRSSSPVAKEAQDASNDDGKASITQQILAISEKIRSRKATPKPLRKRTVSKKKSKGVSKSKSPKKLPISRGNTLLKRVDEGDNAKILFSPKPGSVTRSMINEEQEKIHYNDKYYN